MYTMLTFHSLVKMVLHAFIFWFAVVFTGVISQTEERQEYCSLHLKRECIRALYILRIALKKHLHYRVQLQCADIGKEALVCGVMPWQKTY